jgi:hypothetical protein
MTAVLWEGGTNTNNEREHDSKGLLKRGGMTHWKAFFTFLNSLDSMDGHDLKSLILKHRNEQRQQ